MGRSTTRAGPSQSQKPSQAAPKGRGSKRSAPPPVEEDEEEEEEGEQSDEGEGEGEQVDMDVDNVDENSDVARKANAVVRLALFTEHKRAYLRREDITKKALGASARSFNQIFELAQQKLRETFGMELVLLPSRAVLDNDGEAKENLGQNPTGMKKKSAATSSKNYVLRSILDPLLVEHAAQTEEDILEAEAADQTTLFAAFTNIDGDEEGEGDSEDDIKQEAKHLPKYYGSIISWSKSDQLGSVGILYVILSLILVHGRIIPDGKLRQYLKTLRLPSNPAIKPIQHTSTSTVREMNVDSFLSLLLKQGYLHRQLVGDDVAKKGKKAGGGAKRVRAQADDLQAGQMFEWRWGARAFAEVGEELVAKFVAEFMVSGEEGGEEEEEEEEEGTAAASAKSRARQEETLKSMYHGVEKAAGGKLVELK